MPEMTAGILHASGGPANVAAASQDAAEWDHFAPQSKSSAPQNVQEKERAEGHAKEGNTKLN